MKNHHKFAESYPKTNTQALDLITFSFVLTCSILIGLYALVKLAKAVYQNADSIPVINRFLSTPSKLSREEYRLTSMNGDDDDEEEGNNNNNSDVQYLMKRVVSLEVELAKRNKFRPFWIGISGLILTAALYLGIRTINLGLALM